MSQPLVTAFPEAATIDVVETLVSRSLASAGAIPTLVLDFSQSTFIEIAALQYVTALVASRKSNGLATQLRLPAGERGFRARSTLRRWNYPKAFREATGIRFDDFVAEADLEYFRGRGGDAQDTPYRGAQAEYDLPSGKVQFTVDAHRFFEFVTWRVADYRESKRLVIDAYDSWNVAPVMAVLNRNLRKPIQAHSPMASTGLPDVYVASRVFFEAMTNAVRHPNAKVIQTSSHLNSGKVSSHFTIVFWDDGMSMLQTLSEALRAGKNIRRPYGADFESDFALTRESSDGRKSEVETINSSRTPDAADDGELILLSTLFPGTTCNFEGRDNWARKELTDADHRLGEPGMGLFVLISTVIDMFGGSVAFRTDRYFMNVKRETRKRPDHSVAKYAVKVRRFPESVPPFLGNMVTVRLPLGVQ